MREGPAIPNERRPSLGWGMADSNADGSRHVHDIVAATLFATVDVPCPARAGGGPVVWSPPARGPRVGVAVAVLLREVVVLLAEILDGLLAQLVVPPPPG
mmetsp:Transcript_37852/g.73949  ORF Transcript_37852/g.73949 Transcript_37852/m.73949 type:complete len:100 (-) Transcript_37852:526-825(-)